MTTQQLVLYLLFPAAGYFLGAIPFGWLIGMAKGTDIRTVGSKNIGATNLGRTFGKKYFWYAFLLDAAKGFFPVLVAAQLTHAWGSPAWTPLLTAMACVLGHNFPVWLKFKGGKGVATSLGVVLGYWPLFTCGGIVGGLTFIFMVLVYRYISLASITAAAAFAGAVTVFAGKNAPGVRTELAPGDFWPMVIIAWLFAGLIVYRHRANIVRLRKGTEPKIGQKQVDKARMDAPEKR
jgi:acyl phosphate:glycerol-3-phosphate acyltransferase